VHRAAVVVLVLAACHGGSSRDPSARCDTTTDDGVRAAYQKATGKTLPPKGDQWSCVDKAYDFPGAVKIGDFADDRGCSYSGVLYGCTFASAPDLQPKILADKGWATADHPTREHLISAYWSDLYDTGAIAKGDDFPTGHTFAPPTFTWNADGSVTYSYWHAESHGMTCGSHYYHVEDHVNADGSLGPSKPLEDFDQGC
jgi:hypothetical protein